MDIEMEDSESKNCHPSGNEQGNALPSKKNDDGICFLDKQEANNILKAVYKEIMTIAFQADYFVKCIPPVGAIEELQKVFQISPPSDMRIETSTGTAILPIPAPMLCSKLMDVDFWSRTMSHILYNGGSYGESGIFGKLMELDNSILEVKKVNLEFQLPTPFVEAQRFSFLRFLKLITPNELWAIIDVSKDYFDHRDVDYMVKDKCRMRPSGIIITSRDNNCEIIWIQNVEVPKLSQFPGNIYSEIINSDMAFCAKRWIDALSWSLKRNRSTWIVKNLQLGFPSHSALLSLAEHMKLDFMECLREFPDEKDWLILYDSKLRIMLDSRTVPTYTSSSSSFASVVSFRIQAKPFLVFQYLLKKNLELQWYSLLNMHEVAEVLRSAPDDRSNCITLHRKNVQVGRWKSREYLLQESAWDGFSYYIISTIMSEAEVHSSLIERFDDAYFHPTGFTIVPDGPNSSLVTFSRRRDLRVDTVNEGIELMIGITSRIVAEIRSELNHEVKSGDCLIPEN